MTTALLIFRAAVAASLIAAIGEWPYAYFTVLRVVTTVAAIELMIVSRKQQKASWTFVATVIAVLWNPLVPFNFPRAAWLTLDMLAAGVLLASIKSVTAAGVHVSSDPDSVASRPG